jgi:hypothetical protein
MISYEAWVSLDETMRRIHRNATALFVLYVLLDAVGLIGIAFIPYCEARNEVWALIAALIGVVPICLSPYLLYEYFHTKHDRYSVFTLLDKNAVCNEAFDDAIRNAQPLGSRIALTQKALYSLKSSYSIPFVIPTKDIVWLYVRRRWYDKHDDHCLSVATKDKRIYRLPLGAKLLFSNATKGTDTLVLRPLRAAYPHLFVGYTAQNRMLFKERFSEMAERVEKSRR